MSQIEITERRPTLSPLACRLAYEAVLMSAASHRSALLQARIEALAAFVRRAAARSACTSVPGQAARHWLKSIFGQEDEALKRASVAALALTLESRVAGWPPELLALHPAAHARLAAFLVAKRRYNEETFSRDIAFAAGLATPAGALTVTVPDPTDGDSLAPRTKRAAGLFCRQVLQYGAGPARAWLAEVGVGAWAELHVDVRDLEDFNLEGFLRCYHRLAALMRARPDLAGVFGASWLYDPELAHVSPGLAYVRRTAEDGGGRLLRLKVDPIQTAHAIARSPSRRKLVQSGAYRPVCYGMYWRREALLAWAEQDSLAERIRKGEHLQLVRS